MAEMTEKEAARLDELYTQTTPAVNPNKPGILHVKRIWLWFTRKSGLRSEIRNPVIRIVEINVTTSRLFMEYDV